MGSAVRMGGRACALRASAPAVVTATEDVPTPRRVRAYVDGFNLYFGALKGRPQLKWLDLVAFVERYLPPGHVLDHVHYFTAGVSAEVDRRAVSVRQGLYLDALVARGRLTVHKGVFRRRIKRMAVASTQPVRRRRDGSWAIAHRFTEAAREIARERLGLPAHVWCSVTEEKGSDVNLACELLGDALAGAIDLAIVVSDDTDLARPCAMARAAGVRVIVLSPRGTARHELAPEPADRRELKPGALRASQLPESLNTATGRRIRRPPEWV